MEQPSETNATRLLDGVTGIIKRHEAQWQKTGEKYNLFKVADIARKEVIMCRVFADLMDPQGKHGQGSRYLRLYWKTITPKLLSRPALDFEHTRVTTECVTDKNRRIDIALEDDKNKLFVPIEVKIRAGDQPKQLADYFNFARTKNGSTHVPVLYLTVDGHEPQDFSKADLGKNDYVKLSFKNHILDWLEACAQENTPETTIPVRENLRQLIAAVKSLCGYSEDKAMEKEVAELITQSEESIRTAVAIKGVLENAKKESWELFKGSILEKVKNEKERSEARSDKEKEDGTIWKGIYVLLLSGQYSLYITDDWKTILIGLEGDKANPALEEKLAKEMSKITGCYNEKADGNWKDAVWATSRARYPGMENVEVAYYDYELYRQFIKDPDAVAHQIVSIVQALEKV
ncbi:hypothetical protein FACS189479_06100 [Spirochaetia bacterium]|nr:hypothetical protein FACS189479_06100 [Spirochaetia bacterium]